MNPAVSRVLRTILQLLAAGAFTALFEQIAKDSPSAYTPYVLFFSTLLVTIAQNAYESTSGKMLLRPTIK